MNVLALDPGGTTGCAMRFSGHCVSVQECRWHTQHTRTPQDLWELLRCKSIHYGPELSDVFHFGGWDLVGYERFASSVATSQPAIYTMELCGSIQGVCHVLGIKCQRFEPANRTAWLEEAAAMVKGRRKEEGKPFGPLIVHEIDAMAHLLRYEAVGWDAAPKHGKWGQGLRGGGTGPGVMQRSRGVVLS